MAATGSVSQSKESEPGNWRSVVGCMVVGSKAICGWMFGCCLFWRLMDRLPPITFFSLFSFLLWSLFGGFFVEARMAQRGSWKKESGDS